MAGLTIRDEIALAIEAGFGDTCSHVTTYEDKTEVYIKGHDAPIIVLPELRLALPRWVGYELSAVIVADAQCILDIVLTSESINPGGQQHE